eukprot:6214469-Pleurochrysis_carterae.AAC.3
MASGSAAATWASQLRLLRKAKEGELRRLAECKKEYDMLADSLQKLPEHVERPVFVPLGKMASFPGRSFVHSAMRYERIRRMSLGSPITHAVAPMRAQSE